MTLQRTPIQRTAPLKAKTPLQRTALKSGGEISRKRPSSLKSEEPQRIRYAWVICPHCNGEPDMRMQREDGTPLRCPWCEGQRKIKAQLIRVAAGSGAKGGMSKMKRDAADARFSKAIRERENWICTVCHKDFRERPDIFDAMHLVKRRYRALRKGFTKHTGDGCCLKHDMGNALAGCRSCHMRLEGKPENEQHFRDWYGDTHVDDLLGQKPKSEKIVPRRL